MEQWKKDLLRLYCEAQANLNPRLRKLYRKAAASGNWAPLRTAIREHKQAEADEAARVKASWAEFAGLWKVEGEPNA